MSKPVLYNPTAFVRIVNVAQRRCSCGFFQDHDFSCGHSFSAIFALRQSLWQHVSQLYMVIGYLATYDGVLHPVDIPSLEQQLWPSPPPPRNAPGRRRRRRLEAGNATATSRQDQARLDADLVVTDRPQRCTRCRVPGHNARTCTGAVPSFNSCLLHCGITVVRGDLIVSGIQVLVA